MVRSTKPAAALAQPRQGEQGEPGQEHHGEGHGRPESLEAWPPSRRGTPVVRGAERSEGGGAKWRGPTRPGFAAWEQPVRRVWIPKLGKPGKMRPLGIASAADRAVQQTLKIVIEPIGEADFLPCSLGFRPRRSAHGAKPCGVRCGRAGHGWWTLIFKASWIHGHPAPSLIVGSRTGCLSRLVARYAGLLCVRCG